MKTKEERERLIEIVKQLNIEFRKDNIPQKLSGDELNDLWEEKIIEKIEKLGKNIIRFVIK